MRDLERLHDAVEYRVNPGQLKLAFLGVLAVACAIFAVGVTVGQKLIPEGTALAASDPLAELDRAEGQAPQPGQQDQPSDQPPSLTYHDELTEGAAPPAQRQNSNETEATPEPAPQAAAPAPPQPEPAPPAPAKVVPQPAPTGPVQNEPARPEEPAPGESSVYTLQVASFETREEADQFAADLRSRGHRVFLVRTSTEERGTWYRVRVGPFHSRREATSAQSRFERVERLPTFLVQRRRR